jgi:hypothetical protein
MSSRQGFDRGGTLGGVTQGVLESAIKSNLGSIATLKPSAKYTTGARTIIKINNEIAAFCFAVSWNIITDNVEINTIDSYLPHELAPRRITVEGTLGSWIYPAESLTSMVIQSDVLSFLFNKYITIEVLDNNTQNILFKTNNAVITGSSANISAEQLGSMTLSWKAIGWKYNEDIQYPKEYDKEKPMSVLDVIKGVTSGLR